MTFDLRFVIFDFQVALLTSCSCSFRVISWIVSCLSTKGTIHEATRSITKCNPRND